MIKNIAPLNGSFMIVSILGIIASLIYVMPRSPTWGFTFAAFFVIMFIAAMISMTYGPEEAMLHAGHEKDIKRQKRIDKELFELEKETGGYFDDYDETTKKKSATKKVAAKRKSVKKKTTTATKKRASVKKVTKKKAPVKKVTKKKTNSKTASKKKSRR